VVLLGFREFCGGRGEIGGVYKCYTHQKIFEVREVDSNLDSSPFPKNVMAHEATVHISYRYKKKVAKSKRAF
jgi:hypothetical protein